MITVYGFGPGYGLPEIGPYVTKTQVQLQMAGLKYQTAKALPPDSPKGQLPFIDDDGALIADSTFIRAHIERKYRVDLDEGLNARERAEAWAIERMIENHFGFAVTYTRWLIPENFEKGFLRNFHAPTAAEQAAYAADVLARVKAGLMAQGTARHSPDEVVELGARSLAALSLFLDDKPWLMGQRPSGVDATAFAMLAGLMTPFFDSALRERAEKFGNLLAYVDRLMARFYPEHPWGEAPALAREAETV